jgi:hypothetical protein
MERVGRIDHINTWFADYVARVAGSDVDPDTLSAADIKALPRSRPFLQPSPFQPVHEPEILSGSVTHLTPEEQLERIWRADRFLEMTGVHLLTEERALS